MLQQFIQTTTNAIHLFLHTLHKLCKVPLTYSTLEYAVLHLQKKDALHLIVLDLLYKLKPQ